MKIHSAYLILITLTFSLCQSQNPQSDLLQAYPTVQIPHTDSTNFDNHKPDKTLTYEQVKLFGLDRVLDIHPIAFKESKVGVNYLLDLSPDFTTVVFYYYFMGHEMSSTLVTYDKDFNVIDSKMIAMDEIAESILRSESTIQSDKITIIHYKFLNITEKEIEIVTVLPNGKIKTRR